MLQTDSRNRNSAAECLELFSAFKQQTESSQRIPTDKESPTDEESLTEEETPIEEKTPTEILSLSAIIRACDRPLQLSTSYKISCIHNHIYSRQESRSSIFKTSNRKSNGVLIIEIAEPTRIHSISHISTHISSIIKLIVTQQAAADSPLSSKREPSKRLKISINNRAINKAYGQISRTALQNQRTQTPP